jgi:pantothenate kinase
MASRPPEIWRGHDVAALARRLEEMVAGRSRLMVGVTGPPGAGKSMFAGALAEKARGCAVVVPMDGFHLADCELDRLGRRERKGAPDTFDAAGFVHLLRRIREVPDDVVYAPVFEREQETAIAGALPISRQDTIVIVEGNYLLSDGAFAPVRTLLDACWYVDPDDDERRRWLVDRHTRHGRSRAEAEAWVHRTDEPNARLIAGSRCRADLLVQLHSNAGPACTG